MVDLHHELWSLSRLEPGKCCIQVVVSNHFSFTDHQPNKVTWLNWPLPRFHLVASSFQAVLF